MESRLQLPEFGLVGLVLGWGGTCLKKAFVPHLDSF